MSGVRLVQTQGQEPGIRDENLKEYLCLAGTVPALQAYCQEPNTRNISRKNMREMRTTILLG